MIVPKIFAYYPDEPNFMTFMLSRTDIGTVDGGEFTIGALAEQNEITNLSSLLCTLQAMSFKTSPISLPHQNSPSSLQIPGRHSWTQSLSTAKECLVAHWGE